MILTCAESRVSTIEEPDIFGWRWADMSDARYVIYLSVYCGIDGNPHMLLEHNFLYTDVEDLLKALETIDPVFPNILGLFLLSPGHWSDAGKPLLGRIKQIWQHKDMHSVKVFKLEDGTELDANLPTVFFAKSEFELVLAL